MMRDDRRRAARSRREHPQGHETGPCQTAVGCLTHPSRLRRMRQIAVTEQVDTNAQEPDWWNSRFLLRSGHKRFPTESNVSLQRNTDRWPDVGCPTTAQEAGS